MTRRYDFVLFGATGFTGRLTALYLAQHAPTTARWALAGRSRERLNKIRNELLALRPELTHVDVLQADTTDAQALKNVAESTRVITTTVGPYILHGEPLVAACAAAGTHYLDLTGEPEFADTMWLKYHQQAVASGARIVHACGFDSIPHDLGALFTVQQFAPNSPIDLSAYVSAQASFSAGTFHSAIHAMSHMRAMANAAKARAQGEMKLQPMASGRRVGTVARGLHRPEVLPSWWAVPMPTIDPQIVKRSARALPVFGPDFRYGHFLALPKFKHVAGLGLGMGALLAMVQVPALKRWLLAKKSSGEGPDEARRAASKFSVTFVGTSGPKRVVTRVSGGDPGYGETSKMLAEATLCMAFDQLPQTAGQVTTAVAMGDALIARLKAAGIVFEVIKRD